MKCSAPTRAARSEAGMSLAELLVAFTILLLALSGLVRVLLGNFALNEQARGMAIAMHGSRALLEQMRDVRPEDVFYLYNDTAVDDPAAGAPGPDFQVPGLNPAPDDLDGIVGEVIFPVQPGAPGILSELANAEFPSLPRDLNMDGDAADPDVTYDVAVLPVRLRLRWVGPSGVVQTYELSTLLASR